MSTLQRRQRNRITSLRDDVGSWLTQEEHIKIHIIDFYSSFYAADLTSCNRLFLIANSQFVPTDIASTLIAPLNHREVVDAIFFSKPLKDSGPDDLHLFSINDTMA